MTILKYKDYEGTAEIDMDSMICRGKILFISDLVTYKAENPAALKAAFIEAVDDYEETCRLLNRPPQKPLRGQFNVRVSPDTHRAAHLRAATDNTSLNDVVSRALDIYLSQTAEISHHVTLKVDIDNPESHTVIATTNNSNWSVMNATTRH